MTAMNRKLFSLQSFAEYVENKQFFSSKSFLNAEQFNKSTNSQKVFKLTFFGNKNSNEKVSGKTGIVFHLPSWSKK
jgi:hypothetical protein